MRGRLREALAILLLGIAPLLLLEVGLRLAGWPTERVRTFSKLLNFDAQVWNTSIGVFQPSSGATVMWPPELAYSVEINSLGLRGPEIDRTPPPDSTRVLAVGDSQTFGFYLENDQTWPARLEARLRADGSKVEVVNAGVGGWSIDSETQFLIERGLALQPQVVLLGYCGNDIADLAAAEPRYEGQKRLMGSGSGPLERAVYTSALYELHLRGMVALNHWKRKTFGDSREGTPAPSLSPERNEALWASYAQWLDRLHEVLAARDIQLFLVFIPGEREVLEGYPADDEARLRVLAEQRGIAYVSALAAFQASPDPKLYHVPLDHHLATEGADRLARVVAESIEPTLVAIHARNHHSSV